MKILFDENLPEDFKKEFPEFEVLTVNDMKWNTKKNGELLELMIEYKFQILVTLDKNLRHQQNLKKFAITVICLRSSDSKLETLFPMISELKSKLSNLPDTNYFEIGT